MANIKSSILSILKQYGPKWFLLRKLFRDVLKVLYPNGMRISLGNRYSVRIIPDFVGYVTFGDRHNIGWSHCIDSLTEDETFIDIGAHIGLYTLPAALKLKKGRVYAFEPASSNYNILKKHIKMNSLSNVEIFDYLVGDKGKSVKFYESKNLVSPKNSIVKVDKISSFEPIIKKQISLDNFFLGKNIHPNVIKIDVEGAELFVLKGAKNIITKTKPKIYLSIHPQWLENLGLSVNQLLSLIKELDYSIYDMNMNHPYKINLSEYIILPN